MPLSTALLLSIIMAGVEGENKLRVDADIPGGNIVVDKIDAADIHVHQDLRDTAGDWFYWHFRVRGGQGRKITVHFTKGNPIGVRGPAVSTDGGKSWQWLGPQAVRGAAFLYDFPRDTTEVRFCFAFPYVLANLQEFLKPHANNPHLKIESLCTSKKGRDVPLLFLGRLDGKATHRVALTCRHHACEMMASYALEGLIAEVLANTDAGRWLREHVEFFIVPVVDLDGVEDGDQGKNRKPIDVNRDYVGDSYYPSVGAIRRRLPAWSAGRLRFALDMHCPAIRGSYNETVYFVGGKEEQIWKEVGRFSRLLEATQSGPLVFSSKNNLPYGQSWNTQANYGTRKAFSQWAGELPGVTTATTIEIAYSNADGKPVTDHSARALGHDLARALRQYLETMPQSSTQRRPRARDLGVIPGILPTGRLNAITDIPGVAVGHSTLVRGDNVRTGVTAILPHANNLFREKVPGAVFVGNGFGKLVGSTQVNELGEIETPILLTSTLNVPRVADALLDFMLAVPGNEDVRSINFLVAETNDGRLNDIRGRHVGKEDVLAAIKSARGGEVDEGSVGAGTGVIAFGFRGGIGTSSRCLPRKLGGYTVGVLVQTNFGGVLSIAGAPVGKELGRYYLKDELKEKDRADGSVIVVLATDAPLDFRNLQRLGARAMLGLARTGAAATNGSGDYAIAFSAAPVVRICPPKPGQEPAPRDLKSLPNEFMSPLFLAAIEATEEAVYNSLFRATTITGQGLTVEALPIERTVEILRKYGVVPAAKAP